MDLLVQLPAGQTDNLLFDWSHFLTLSSHPIIKKFPLNGVSKTDGDAKLAFNTPFRNPIIFGTLIN